MEELLRQNPVLNVDRLQGLVSSLLLFWLIWPVVCGFLGASRGKTATGVFHGLMWGPFGILFVIMSSKKHRCPTCGEMTLKQPSDEFDSSSPAAPVRRAFVVPPPSELKVPPPPLPLSATHNPTPVELPAPALSPEERDLRAWLNGETTSTSSACSVTPRG